MANVEWRIRGVEFAACTCSWGCPCQFNARPTHGKCEAVVAMRIDDGEFDRVSLDGLCWVGAFAWPGAIHEGGGRVQVYIDERASDAQMTALLTILSGKESDPGANVFEVFSHVIDQMYEPQRVPIEFAADVERRTGRVVVPGVIESVGEPIINPVTGQPHRARLTLPQGFEYHEAEFASSTFHAGGAVAIRSAGGHGHFARIEMSGHGVVH